MVKTKRNIKKKYKQNRYKKKLTKKRKNIVKDDMIGGFLPGSMYETVNGLYLDFNDTIKSKKCRTCYRKYMTHPNVWKNDNKDKNYEDLDLLKYLPETEKFFRFGFENKVIEECGECGSHFKILSKGMNYPPLMRDIYKYLLENNSEIYNIGNVLKSTFKKYDNIIDNISDNYGVNENPGNIRDIKSIVRDNVGNEIKSKVGNEIKSKVGNNIKSNVRDKIKNNFSKRR